MQRTNYHRTACAEQFSRRKARLLKSELFPRDESNRLQELRSRSYGIK
jgi:hypothetical protein